MRGPPTNAAAALEKRKEEIKSPDDLAAVVKLVLAETGPLSTKRSWVVFNVGGSSNLMIECTSETFAVMRELVEYCDQHGYSPDGTLSGLALNYMSPPMRQATGEVVESHTQEPTTSR